MKRSVLKNGFPKNLLLVAVGLFPAVVFGQLNITGTNANFGIDGDTRANYSKFAWPANPGPNVTDDWFSFYPGGRGVIDTTNTVFYRNQLLADKNISFTRGMSAAPYAQVNNKLWIDAVYMRDYTSAITKDSTAFGNGGKNGANPASWNGAAANVPFKTDIVDTYAHFRRDGSSINDSLWLQLGTSIIGTNGDRYFDVELFKKGVSYNRSTGQFTSAGLQNGHTEWVFDLFGNIIQTGDLIIAVNYSPNSAPVVEVRIWVSKLTYLTVNPSRFNFGGAFDGGALYGYASIVANSNNTRFGSGCGNYSNNVADTTYATPWGTVNTSGNWQDVYSQLQYIEVALNFTRMGIDPSLYSTLPSCATPFNTLFFKSRSSTSFTANLQDFAGPMVFAQTPMPIQVTALQKDTLTCAKDTATLSITSNIPSAKYYWTTNDGAIIDANADSSVIKVNQKGTYMVSAQLAPGCPVNSLGSVYVPKDTIAPVVVADIALTTEGRVQLLANSVTPSLLSTTTTLLGNILSGGNSSNGNNSHGLTYKWEGPNGFTSIEQNPVIDGDWIWGSYYLTVIEKRNGCPAMASLDIAFRPGAGGAGEIVAVGPKETATTVLIQNREFKSTGNKFYLVATETEASAGVIKVYSMNGQLLVNKKVTLTKGTNTIELPLHSSGQVRVATLEINNKPSMIRKVVF